MWQFTEGSKKVIRETIRAKLKGKVPVKKVETFITQLEWLCSVKKRMMKQPKRADVRVKRERVLKDCKAALRHLEQIGMCTVTIARDESVDCDVGRAHNPDAYSGFSTMCWAMEAAEPLEKLIEERHGSEEKRPGNAPAGSDNFERRVKDLYVEHVGGEPTGCFYEIVQEVRASLGLPYEYATKPVKAARKET
jgi:hypothetical protein